MKINSQYAAIINKFLASEADKASGEGNSPEAKNKTPGDRTEVSRLMGTVQRELENMEQKGDPERTRRLQSITEAVQSGNYRVDSEELASAMLENRL